MGLRSAVFVVAFLFALSLPVRSQEVADPPETNTILTPGPQVLPPIAPTASSKDFDPLFKEADSLDFGFAAINQANSCPALRCSLKHTAGSVCGVRLCSLPGFPHTVFRAWDLTYHRVCFYGC